MKRDVITLLFGVLACCALSLIVLAPQNADWVKNHEGAAAWIQASFSILAIYVALMYPRIDAAIRQRAEHARMMKLLAELVKFADAHLQMAGQAKDSQESARNFFARESFARFTEARDALTSFPITVFNDASEARELMLLRAAMAEAVSILERGIAGNLAQDRALVLVNYQRTKAKSSIERLSGK